MRRDMAASPMGTQDLEGDQLSEAKDELKTDVVGVFRNLGDFKCQALEQKEIDGVMCNPVHVSGVGDSYQIFFLKTDDNLVKMIQSPGNAPMTVPRKQPSNASRMFCSVKATANPSPNSVNVSIETASYDPV